MFAVSIEGKHRFSKTSRPSITLTRGHGSKATRTAGPSCGTGTCRAAVPGLPTSARFTSFPANFLTRWGHPDSMSDLRREHHDHRARPRMPSSGHDAKAWRLGDPRTHRSAHAVRPNRSLQGRIKEAAARWRARTALQRRRHGDRIERRRSLAWGPHTSLSSCVSTFGPAAALSRHVPALRSYVP